MAKVSATSASVFGSGTTANATTPHGLDCTLTDSLNTGLSGLPAPVRSKMLTDVLAAPECVRNSSAWSGEMAILCGVVVD
jgi:hypothetical protein